MSRMSLRISGISGAIFPKSQPCKKIGVEPYHFMTSGMKHRSSNGADVAFMTCE